MINAPHVSLSAQAMSVVVSLWIMYLFKGISWSPQNKRIYSVRMWYHVYFFITIWILAKILKKKTSTDHLILLTLDMKVPRVIWAVSHIQRLCCSHYYHCESCIRSKAYHWLFKIKGYIVWGCDIILLFFITIWILASIKKSTGHFILLR